MITVSEAFAILENQDYVTKVIELPLLQARNHVLAETLRSPIDMPPFRQATMDGFAVALHDSLVYSIVGEVKAGDVFSKELQAGQAVKIFTGALVPDSVQAVIQIEKVTFDNNILQLQEAVNAETNVRQKGAQIAAGEAALEKGTLLNAAAIGFLAGLGFDKVKVFQRPVVAVVTTGNELVETGVPLSGGKVYNSNTVMLQTALMNANIENINCYKVTDDFRSTETILRQAIAENDVILISGGISVGDYDFVGRALQSLAVTTLFYKVSQKPGKPLFVGKTDGKMIFALPGNPAAALTCFYIYVGPAIQKLAGVAGAFRSQLKVPLTHDFRVNNPRAQFLKARLAGNAVTVLSHQDSAMLNTFALANALVFLPEGNYQIHCGDQVVVYVI